VPANPQGPQGLDVGREPSSRPRAASRSARRRSALLKRAVRVGVSAALLAALHWGTPYFRQRVKLSAPVHSAIHDLLTVSRSGLAIFLLAELSLLAMAVLTVGRPVLHRRFVNLMLSWSYALVTPYLVIRSRRLPQDFQLPETEAARDGVSSQALPQTSSGSQEMPNGVTPPDIGPPQQSPSALDSANPAQQPSGAAEPPPARVTRDDYRKAVQLLLQLTQVLQQDRELLNLLLRQLSEPEQVSSDTGEELAQTEAPDTSLLPPLASEPAEDSSADLLPAAEEQPTGAVKNQEYRKAVQLLLQHTQVLQQDRELINLLLSQLTEPDHDDHIVGLAQIRVVGQDPSSAASGPGDIPIQADTKPHRGSPNPAAAGGRQAPM